MIMCCKFLVLSTPPLSKSHTFLFREIEKERELPFLRALSDVIMAPKEKKKLI